MTSFGRRITLAAVLLCTGVASQRANAQLFQFTRTTILIGGAPLNQYTVPQFGTALVQAVSVNSGTVKNISGTTKTTAPALDMKVYLLSDDGTVEFYVGTNYYTENPVVLMHGEVWS